VTNGPRRPEPRPEHTGDHPEQRQTPGWIIGLLVVATLGLLTLVIVVQLRTPGVADEITHAAFLTEVRNDHVATVATTSDTGEIAGTFVDGTSFEVQGPPSAIGDADPGSSTTRWPTTSNEQIARVRRVLHDCRGALEAAARELIDHETVDGATVARHVEETPPSRVRATRSVNRARLSDTG
jgi:hypothetical protein